MSKIIWLIIGLLLMAAPAWGATCYVKWDAAGLADGSSWTDAYTTVQAGLTSCATSGDVIEVSGGTSGHSYNEGIAPAGDGITLRGSTESNHNGWVTVDATGLATFGFRGLYSCTVERMSITGSEGGWQNLRLDQNKNYTFNTIITYGGAQLLYKAGTGLATFNDSIFIGSDTNVTVSMQIGHVTLGLSQGGVLFERCYFKDDLTGDLIWFYDGVSTKIKNCKFSGVANRALYGRKHGQQVDIYNSLFWANAFSGTTATYKVIDQHVDFTGSINVYTSRLYPAPKDGDNYNWDIDTDSGNIYETVFFLSPRRGGFISLGIDDRGNQAFWESIADYANGKGIFITFNLSSPDQVSDWTNLITYTSLGNEVACHSRTHPQLAVLEGLDIDGPAGSTLSISTVVTDASSANWTGTVTLKEAGSPIGGYPLTLDSSYDTLSELCTQINSETNWTCALASTRTVPDDNDIFSLALANITDQDTSTTYTAMLSTTPFWYYETVEPKAVIETNIPGYTVNSLVPPGNNTSETLQDYLKTEANFTPAGTTAYTNARTSTSGGWSLSDDHISAEGTVGLKTFYLYGPEPASLIGTTNIKRNAQSFGEWLNYVGGAAFVYSHGAGEYTLQNWKDLIDALSDINGLTITTTDKIIDHVINSGQWTDADADGERWTRTYEDNSDFRLQMNSPAIRAGTGTLPNGVPCSIGANEVSLGMGPEMMSGYLPFGSEEAVCTVP